ncbi:hypothetical protein JXA48_04305 [Candidatus Woesearchaeota archaeon]|nr:hypothetical protein [Candidatus Woesearchaeota archaeon]
MSPEIEKLIKEEGWEQKIKNKISNEEFEKILIQFKGNKKAFKQAWENKGGTNAEKVFDIILEHHQKPHRAYHNITHVSHMLDGLNNSEDIAEDKTAIKIAIWFHDAIYDPTKKDNEEKSAELAYNQCIDNGILEEESQKIKKLILATKHSTTPQTNDEKIIADLDLVVLGLDLKTFKIYSEALRKEYDFVGEVQYWKNRKIVFERFLEQEKLFYTEFFKEKYEKQALKNIEWGIIDAENHISRA